MFAFYVILYRSICILRIDVVRIPWSEVLVAGSVANVNAGSFSTALSAYCTPIFLFQDCLKIVIFHISKTPIATAIF